MANDFDSLAEQIQDQKRRARSLERQFRRFFNQFRKKGISMSDGTFPYKTPGMNLKQELVHKLPAYLMPGNVGDLNSVSWPFFFSIEFDFNDDPTLSNAIRQFQQFRVDQEAAFIWNSLFLDTNAYSTAGFRGPYQFIIRDRQSSRQLNDAAIPLQMIGTKANPAILPTPFLIMPTALIETEMTSWLPAGVSQATSGSSKIQLTYGGYRVRIQDAHKVLSTIYA
jgi:hypothetical protein